MKRGFLLAASALRDDRVAGRMSRVPVIVDFVSDTM